MNDHTDSQLLRAYAEERSEPAFAELVGRYIDLVYSAARRMVCNSHLAEDVTQGVFLALAKSADQLADRAVLSGWLHRTAQNIAAQTVRTDVRRRAREQEAAAMNELLSNDPEASWDDIAPQLDDALGELSEADRDALLLRYFERKSAREMAESLGISDEAAQKRVNRAVERLRECFSKRGVAVGTSGLAVLISANAVQSAPATLAAQIVGSAFTTTTIAAAAAAATKTIAMTTLQKTIIGTTLVAAVGTGIFQTYQVSQLREQNKIIIQQQAPFAAQLQQLQRERDEATNQLALVAHEVAQLKSEQKQAEVLKLRGQVGSLQNRLTEAKAESSASGFAKMMSDPNMREYIHHAMTDLVKRRYDALFQELKLTPDQIERFIQIISKEFEGGAERLATAQRTGGNLADLSETERTSHAETGKELQELLGESGAARFASYSQEVPARTTVDLLNVQLGANKLTSEQAARLLQLVKAEPFDLTHGIAGDID